MRISGTAVRACTAAVLAAAISLALATGAVANNLDKRTMTKVAKQVAEDDCADTEGCEDWNVRDLHRVSRHKARGKIEVLSVKDGERFSCVRQIVIKLDHVTGKVFYGVSKRDCTNLGPA